ncbi:hypothetical protein [Streptomyces umbrinus]|uniref:hypothetical protein n=1 Tax=Streptomyces umbrinus TaxID=67370 RepID=UPI003C2F4E18
MTDQIMTRAQTPPAGVAREDDPLFDADHSRVTGPHRRASITVADVTAMADGTYWSSLGEVSA